MGESADRLALASLTHDYAAAVDARDIELLLSLFVANGTLAGYFSGEQPEPDYLFRGRGAIRALEARWEPYARLWHFIGTSSARVDGDEAHSLTYCLAHHLLKPPEPDIMKVMSVVYEDICVRTPDGWRIQARVVRKLWSEDRRVELP